MKTAALLIVLLTNDGHWLSGDEGQISMRWSADAAATPCELAWELTLGETRLADQRVAVDGRGPFVVKITCPDVRVHLTLHWQWRLLRKADGKQIASGSEPIDVFPADLTAGWDNLLRGKSIAVVDRPSGIPALLRRAKVPHERF